jgi:hypothetical protein
MDLAGPWKGCGIFLNKEESETNSFSTIIRQVTQILTAQGEQ